MLIVVSPLPRARSGDQFDVLCASPPQIQAYVKLEAMSGIAEGSAVDGRLGELSSFDSL